MSVCPGLRPNLSLSRIIACVRILPVILRTISFHISVSPSVTGRMKCECVHSCVLKAYFTKYQQQILAFYVKL